MSVFIIEPNRHGELEGSWTIRRTGALINIYTERREPFGDPAAIVNLGEEMIVSLIEPQSGLAAEAGRIPRQAGRTPGVYVRTPSAFYGFSASAVREVTYRVAQDDTERFIEIFTPDRMTISNLLDLDYDETPTELLIAICRLAPGVVVGDGLKGIVGTPEMKEAMTQRY